ARLSATSPRHFSGTRINLPAAEGITGFPKPRITAPSNFRRASRSKTVSLCLCVHIELMSAHEQVVFRDYPICIWFTGLMTLSVSLGFLEKMSELLLFSLAGLAIIGFASILTITVDTRLQTLHLRYWSPLRVSTKVYPLNEIGFVNVVEDN